MRRPVTEQVGDPPLCPQQTGSKWCDEDMVFSTSIGTPIEPDNLSRSWYVVRKVLGERAARFHDMRHTCVSLLLAEGAPPHVVQQIVGHSPTYPICACRVLIDATLVVYVDALLFQCIDELPCH